MKAYRIILVIVLLTALGCDRTPTHIRFDKQSAFERVLVIDKGDRRYLRFGSVTAASQSIMSLSDDRAVPTQYIRIAALGMVLTPKLDRALMIGLGGGSFTTLLRRHLPDLRIDAVEIDPVVVEAAERFFGVQEDERFKIHVTDGAEFILKTRAVYDLVLIDAYSGEGIPQALASASFFDAVKAKTSAEGVVILNLFNLKAKERRLLQTFSMRFPKIGCMRSSDDLNLVLFGKTSSMPAHAQLLDAAHRFADSHEVSFDLERIAGDFVLDCRASDG